MVSETPTRPLVTANCPATARTHCFPVAAAVDTDGADAAAAKDGVMSVPRLHSTALTARCVCACAHFTKVTVSLITFKCVFDHRQRQQHYHMMVVDMIDVPVGQMDRHASPQTAATLSFTFFLPSFFLAN